VLIVGISLELHVIFAKFSAHATFDRGTILLCRRCGMLRTSGFMDDVMLHIMTRKIGDANTRSDGRVYDLLTYQQGAASDRGGVCFVLAVIC